MRIIIRRIFKRGRERGAAEVRRGMRLIGIVKAQTHRVKRIRGAERRSVEKARVGEKIEEEGGKMAREVGIKRRGVREVARQ